MKKPILVVTALALIIASNVNLTSAYSQPSGKEEAGKAKQNNETPGGKMSSPNMGSGDMMDQGRRMGPGGMMGQGGMMGRGGMMGPGGMMGQGGMMGMMGAHHGMHGGYWSIERDYTSEDAKRIVNGMLARKGFSKLSVSKAEKTDDDFIKVTVSTPKGEEVLSLKFDVKHGTATIIQ